MKHNAIFFTLALVLSACAVTTPSLTYRPRNFDGAPYVITKSVNTLTNNIVITIDGEAVIDDRLSLLTNTGEFVSKYKGLTVHASCQPQCRLLIDNEYVGVF